MNEVDRQLQNQTSQQTEWTPTRLTVGPGHPEVAAGGADIVDKSVDDAEVGQGHEEERSHEEDDVQKG